jgi:hypothetical protein
MNPQSAITRITLACGYLVFATFIVSKSIALYRVPPTGVTSISYLVRGILLLTIVGAYLILVLLSSLYRSEPKYSLGCLYYSDFLGALSGAGLAMCLSDDWIAWVNGALVGHISSLFVLLSAARVAPLAALSRVHLLVVAPIECSMAIIVVYLMSDIISHPLLLISGAAFLLRLPLLLVVQSHARSSSAER